METKNCGSDSPYKAKWVFYSAFYFSILLMPAYIKVYLNLYSYDPKLYFWGVELHSSSTVVSSRAQFCQETFGCAWGCVITFWLSQLGEMCFSHQVHRAPRDAFKHSSVGKTEAKNYLIQDISSACVEKSCSSTIGSGSTVLVLALRRSCSVLLPGPLDRWGFRLHHWVLV